MRNKVSTTTLWALFLCMCLLSSLSLADSWSQINQSLEKSEVWHQIVKDSPFHLGNEKEVLLDDRVFTEIDFGTYPSIDGSTVAVPMAIEFARQHLGLSEMDLQTFVSFSTTHDAYVNLICKRSNGYGSLITRNATMEGARPVDLFIGTEPSEDELALAKENGVELLVEPICYDAFVFITHVDNSVNSLTLAQIRDIYTGKITSWDQVGGIAEDIHVYQRDRNSGSQTAMENLVMKGTPMISEGVSLYILTEMSSLVAHVGGYTNSKAGIGYTYKFYIDELYNDDTIKILAVDDIAPSEENLRTGAYPFTTCYNGVIRKGDENAPGGLFLAWMQSEEGQRCIQQAGYVPFMSLDAK